MRKSEGLPDFPWDLLEPAKAKAAAHPGGLIDLSIGTPVDSVPELIQRALAQTTNTPGYPLTMGSVALREAMRAWVESHCDAPGAGVLPSIGSKELVAWLPTLLGVGPGDTVVIPEIGYPTYEVGVRLAGATPVRSDSLTALGPQPVKLIWVNSPSNPTGRVLPPAHLRKVVDWARERGTVVASDECYLTLPWTETPVSILSVCDGDYTGVLALHSLSKRSNLAGYRAGFVAGDPALVGELLAVRKHAGMIMPAPVQAAMVAALGDESHVDEQRARYAARREILFGALEKAGFTVDHSEAGLYLWATRGKDCWEEADWFASHGILVSAGSFYGPSGQRHVRVALTVTTEQASEAADRLA
nr:succinyldiaminopimelate transaminase [Catelliglobosispora koreensis]